MIRRLILCLVPALALGAAAGAARAADNPHVEPAKCLACHAKVPTAQDGDRGDYFLVKDTIDDTCRACHSDSCCKAGEIHLTDHPSNINTWDRKLFRRPKTLPLFDGYITCSTCHFYRQAQGSAFKLVRIVTVDGKNIDWTELCHDCHVNY